MAGIPPVSVLVGAMKNVMSHAVRGELSVDTERVALAEIENAWKREQRGTRIVIVP